MHQGIGKWVLACLVVAVMTPGVAVAATPQGALVDDPTLTPAVAEKWKQATKAKDAQIAVAASAARAVQPAGTVAAAATSSLYGLHTLAATNYKQETPYYCGPASARQSLSWHKAKSGSSATLPSQTTLAGRIGTTTSGSLTTGIARALNSYNGTFGTVNYVASNLTDTGSPTSAFYTRIGWMIEAARTVPVILTATARIPRYNGHSSRHYMSVSGINDLSSAVTMRSVDPNPDALYRGVFWDAMGSTTSNGLCRACYQADVDGSNMAMCW
ncbi:MAG: C39 family peptidase [Coriobacteriia bacterium]